MLCEISEKLKNQKNIYIITHVNPDGDALGSSFGLKYALDSLNINAEVVLDKQMPEFFEFTGWKEIIFDENLKADCVVCVDFNDISRCGRCRSLFENAKEKIVMDHHLKAPPICELFYSNPSAAANGEIIMELIDIMGVSINKDIAMSLYIALMTDTGGCKFGNTTANTHLILARLIGLIDHAYINRMVFDMISREKLELKGKLISNIEFYYNNKIGVLTADKNLAVNEDILNGLVNIGLNIEGSCVGILFKERAENEVKISIRTSDNINGMQICTKFSGGGHKNAAGCTIYDTLENAKKLFINETIDYLKNGAY